MLAELFALESEQDLEDLIARRPALAQGRVSEELHELAQAPVYGAGFAPLALLLDGARTDPGAAWAQYAEGKARSKELSDELERECLAIEAAFERRAFDRVIAMIPAALPTAEALGLGLLAGDLYEKRALALINRSSSDRAQDIETAIEALQQALGLAVDPEAKAGLLMHLALAYGERLRGDRAENLKVAVEMLRSTIDGLDPSASPELQALLRTNLAVALMRSEHGDRLAVLTEAAQLCRDALSYRSPKRDAVDWAYSQINLGEVVEELAAFGQAELSEARRAYGQVIEQQTRLPEQWLVGAAHQALGRSYLSASRRGAQELVEAHENGELEEAFDTGPDLQLARGHLERARELMRDSPDPLRYARVLEALSDVLDKLDVKDQAIELAREALAILRPDSAPRDCRVVGGRLGYLLAEREEWKESAKVFSIAVEAAELSFHGRLDTEAREREAADAGNLNRWAAYAIARAGDPAAAVLVLENGRARELRRRLGLLDEEQRRLAELPSGIRDEYIAASRELVGSPLHAAAAPAGRRLQQVLAAIRELPGFEGFATGSRLADLAAALEPGWPIVYVNPTPYGTVLLRVSERLGAVWVHATYLQTTSTEVFMRLIVGDRAADDEFPLDEVSSYLFGTSSIGDSADDFPAGIEQVLAWSGEAIAKPIAASLKELGAGGVTLIMSGPIAAAPLHAAPWHEDGSEIGLLEDFDVRYAPSAALCAESLRRARSLEGDPAVLVALADPTEDLSAARPEVQEIARHFEKDNVTCAFERDADLAFLRAHAHRATHIHLACHASGGLFERDDAALVLAGGSVSPAEITALVDLHTRLVAVSACQSALSPLSEMPNEVFSIGSAMLAAGGACTVASLWSVHDLATALLMIRLYDEMFENGLRPPEALRRAQLWLRDLTDEEEARFLRDYPALLAEFRRRDATGVSHRFRDLGVSSSGSKYSHPYYWAGFIAVGV